MEDLAVHAFLKDTRRFVLTAGLHPRSWAVPKIEIGYGCRTSLQDRGYVTEVVREFTAAAFRELTAKRVEIRCDSRNQRSRRVAGRAGFRLVAELRWDERANDGSLRDTVVYALLAEDFHRAPAGANTSQRPLCGLLSTDVTLLSNMSAVQGDTRLGTPRRLYWP